MLPRDVTARLGNVIQAPPAPLYEESITTQSADGNQVLLKPVPVKAPSPYLSDRVDDSFMALRARVQQEIGRDFMAEFNNLFEPLDVAPVPGQSNRTWNKAGRAFDLDPRAVLTFDPDIEVVREVEEDGIYWRLYIRASAQDGSMGEPLRQLPWDFRARYGQDARYYDEGGKIKESIPAGYYVDFTALAADYGWQRVAADANWRTFYPGIRFWHFEKREGLSWETALGQLHPLSEIEAIFGSTP